MSEAPVPSWIGRFLHATTFKTDQMPTVMAETLTDRVRSIATEVIERPLYVVDVVVRGQKGSHVVEVFVDSDGDLSVDQLAQASREIGFLLESEDIMPGRYNLNVSSPGVERPLKDPQQFRKNVGRHVCVAFVDESVPALEGELVDAGHDFFTIRPENKDDHRLAYEDVREVRVLLPW